MEKFLSRYSGDPLKYICKMAIQNRVEESNGQTGSWKFWLEPKIKTNKKGKKNKRNLKIPGYFQKEVSQLEEVHGFYLLLMQHSKSADFQWLRKNSLRAQCEVKYLVEKKQNMEGIFIISLI